MIETTKQRTDRLLGMSHGQLVMHAQDLTHQRDELLAALKRLEGYLWPEAKALIARMEEGK